VAGGAARSCKAYCGGIDPLADSSSRGQFTCESGIPGRGGTVVLLSEHRTGVRLQTSLQDHDFWICHSLVRLLTQQIPL
jgi:hypothetical protein